jgi:hypothetical protein
VFTVQSKKVSPIICVYETGDHLPVFMKIGLWYALVQICSSWIASGFSDAHKSVFVNLYVHWDETMLHL